MNALTQYENRDDYLNRFALRELVEHWLDRASIEQPEDPYQFLVDEALDQRHSGGGVVTCQNNWCNMTMPASQLETHQKLCNKETRWTRCVRCNTRVDVSSISVHRMFCRLERCALCGEMVLPRMMAMCPYRMLAEAERNRQAATHRQDRFRERRTQNLQTEPESLARALVSLGSVPSPESASRRISARDQSPPSASSVLCAKRSQLILPLSLSHSSTTASITGTRGEGERANSVSAAPAAPASGGCRSGPPSASITAPQASIVAIGTDSLSFSGDAAATPSTLLPATGQTTESNRSVNSPSEAAVPTQTDSKAFAAPRGPSLLVTSQSRQGGDFGSGDSGAILKSPSAPADGPRPSFPADTAADNALRHQLDNYPDELLVRIRSLQRLWRRSYCLHRFREEVLRAVWRHLENAQERSLGKTAYGTALRTVDRSLREQYSSSLPDVQFRGYVERVTEDKSGRSSGFPDRGSGFGVSLSTSIPDSDLIADDVVSASFEADPVVVLDKALGNGGYMRVRDMEALTRHCQARDVLPLSLVLKIVRSASKLLQKRSLVQHLTVPQSGTLVIVGDLHGQMKDLEYILTFMGLPTAERHYLFNGDFVDRGPYGCEVLTYIYSLLCTYPEYVFLNRGNHENYSANTEYGFMAELYTKYGPRSSYLLDAMVDSYEVMPLMSVVDHRIAVVHGGAPRLECTLDEIEAIGHVRDIPVEHQSTRAEQLLTELLWNDPVEKFRSRQLGTSRQGPGWRSSSRGCGVEYLSNITEQFLTRNGLSFLIRSHDVKTAGFELAHRNKSITVFSASNYGGVSGNRGAVAVLKRGSAQPIFHTWFLRDDHRQEQAEALRVHEDDGTNMMPLPHHHHHHITGMRADVGDFGQGNSSSSSTNHLKTAVAAPLSSDSVSPNASLVVPVPQAGRMITTNVIESTLMAGDEFIQAYYLKSEFMFPEEEEATSETSATDSHASALSEATKPSEEAASALTPVSAVEGAGELSAQSLACVHFKESLSCNSRRSMSGWRTRQGQSGGAGWRRTAARDTSIGEGENLHALQDLRGTPPSLTARFRNSGAPPMTRVSVGLSQDFSITVQLQTIRQIRELIYFNRYALLAAFNQVDEMRTGTVHKTEWCVVTRDILQLDIPWYHLCRYLIPSLEVNGVPSVEYMRFLRHFDVQFALESRLSWQRATILRISSGLDIPEDIISVFCDQPANAMASSTLSRGHNTGSHRSRSNKNLTASIKGSSISSPPPTSFPPRTTLPFPSHAASAAALLPSDAAAIAPSSTMPNGALPSVSLTRSFDSFTSSLGLAALRLGPANSALRDFGDGNNSAASRVCEGFEGERALESVTNSSKGEGSNRSWRDVQISFNTFANKVRLLSPAAAFMEDNEVFALFCYFDVCMVGHVYVGDIVSRMTALLEEEEGNGEEDVLLLSGELDFSTVPGQHLRTRAMPQTMPSPDSSSSSALSAASSDIGNGLQGVVANGASEACGGYGGVGGGRRALLLRKWNNRAANNRFGRLDGGELTVKSDAAEGGDGGTVVGTPATFSYLDRTHRTGAHPIKVTTGREQAKETTVGQASCFDHVCWDENVSVGGVMHGHESDGDRGDVFGRRCTTASTTAPPGPTLGHADGKAEGALPTSAMVLPLEYQGGDATNLPHQQAHGVAAPEANASASEKTGSNGNIGGSSSGPPNANGFCLVSSASAGRDKDKTSGVVCTDVEPMLQANGNARSSEDVLDGRARRAADGHNISAMDATHLLSLAVRRPTLAHDDGTAHRLISTSITPTAVSLPLDDSSTGAPVERLAFSNASDGELKNTSVDTFCLRGSQQDHWRHHQPSQPLSPFVSQKQPSPSRPSRRLATPPWIFSTLLRVQEQLFCSSSHLHALFIALNRSSNGRLSEAEFLSLVEFINCLLEHPLSGDQARELFCFVHDFAIKCVESMQVRHWRAHAVAHNTNRGRAHRTENNAGNSGFQRMSREEANAGVSPPIAGWTSEANAGAYVRSRMQAEQRRGQAYILPIEFVAFLSVRPVPYEEELTALKELLSTGDANATRGGASMTAPSEFTISLPGDSARSHIHHQQQQQQQQWGPGAELPPASILMLPTAIDNARRGPRHGRCSLPSTTEEVVASSVTDAHGVPPPTTHQQQQQQQQKQRLLPQPLKNRVPSTYPPQETESTKAVTTFSLPCDATPGCLDGSGNATSLKATTPATDLLSALVDLRSVYGDDVTLKELLHRLGTSTRRIPLPVGSLCDRPEASHTEGATLPLHLIAPLSPYGACNAATFGRVAVQNTGENSTTSTLAATRARLPNVITIGDSRLSATPTSSTMSAMNRGMMSKTITGHGAAGTKSVCHRQPRNGRTGREGDLSFVPLFTPLKFGDVQQRCAVLHHGSPVGGGLGGIDDPHAPNSPSMWFTTNNLSYSPSNLPMLSAMMPATRPYTLNQPVEQRLTVIPAPSDSSPLLAFGVPLPASLSMVMPLVGDDNSTDMGDAVVASTAGSGRCRGLHHHRHGGRGWKRIVGASLTEQQLEGGLASVSTTSCTKTLLSPRQCATVSTAGVVDFSSFTSDASTSMGLRSSRMHATDVRHRCRSRRRSDEQGMGRRGENSDGGTVSPPVKDCRAEDESQSEWPMGGGGGGGGRRAPCPPRTASPPQRTDEDGAPCGEDAHPIKPFVSTRPTTPPLSALPAVVSAAAPEGRGLDTKSAVRDGDVQEPNTEATSMPPDSPGQHGKASKGPSSVICTLPHQLGTSTSASTLLPLDVTLQPQAKPAKTEGGAAVAPNGERRDGTPPPAQATGRKAVCVTLAMVPSGSCAAIPTPPSVHTTPPTSATTLKAEPLHLSSIAAASVGSQGQGAASNVPHHGVAQPADVVPIPAIQRFAAPAKLKEVLAAAHTSSLATPVSVTPSTSVAYSGAGVACRASPDNSFTSLPGCTSSTPALDTLSYSSFRGACVAGSDVGLPTSTPTHDREFSRMSRLSQGSAVTHSHPTSTPSTLSLAQRSGASRASCMRDDYTSAVIANAGGATVLPRLRALDLPSAYAVQKWPRKQQRLLALYSGARASNSSQQTISPASVTDTPGAASLTTGEVQATATTPSLGSAAPSLSAPACARLPRFRLTSIQISDVMKRVHGLTGCGGGGGGGGSGGGGSGGGDTPGGRRNEEKCLPNPKGGNPPTHSTARRVSLHSPVSVTKGTQSTPPSASELPTQARSTRSFSVLSEGGIPSSRVVNGTAMAVRPPILAAVSPSQNPQVSLLSDARARDGSVESVVRRLSGPQQRFSKEDGVGARRAQQHQHFARSVDFPSTPAGALDDTAGNLSHSARPLSGYLPSCVKTTHATPLAANLGSLTLSSSETLLAIDKAKSEGSPIYDAAPAADAAAAAVASEEIFLSSPPHGRHNRH
ncbi:hypothetical protein JKF63_06433 [Porcisia hertigi]|uniref:Serine/threonine-protein phosphatase n=1 Tax=Porcisia hertigi TaxID=2761500 RepID=A0A836YHH1_9TRYP|nr:hypothetical protein JKF63_06433 [Porcisia hertigi]